ncbi:MAG: RdgB/HAM1 family non-canonical purine NTP pyrophosphatase [Oscillospiraceae bacterium]
MKLLAATGNPHKLEELRRILAHLGVEVISPKEAGVVSDAEETGETFAENARIKALDLYRKSGLPTVADDSGFCVDALNGAPGIYSARYGGEDTDYPTKFALLYKELESVPGEKRAASFVSAICCVLDENTLLECEGVCPGVVADAPRGNSGFGYDPIFLVPEKGKTFAELSDDEKDEISHRGRALRAFAVMLDNYMRNDT